MASPPLVAQRERRPNAGSRMRALLDIEYEAEELFAEEENDIEFVGQEEEDIFESDFASTEEEKEEDEDAREREVLREEKANRKVVKQKQSKGTTKSLFAPKPVTKSKPPKDAVAGPSKPRKRVSIVLPLPKEDDDPMLDDDDDDLQRHRRRQSTRSSTRLSHLALQGRLRESAARKASITARPRRAPPPPKTQDQLIADALELEERNVQSLKEFLAREEEKKRAARTFRKGPVEGGVRGWISRSETFMAVPPPPVQVIDPQTGALQLPESAPIAEKITFGKNYVTLRDLGDALSLAKEKEKEMEMEGEHGKHTAKPTWRWAEEMSALFGSHVKWDSLKVIPHKGRPIHRRAPICPITGLPAPYLDPHTGVPYANARAYRTLQRIVEHDFLWSEGRGVYWADVQIGGAKGVPESWAPTVRGENCRPQLKEMPAVQPTTNAGGLSNAIQGVAGGSALEGFVEQQAHPPTAGPVVDVPMEDIAGMGPASNGVTSAEDETVVRAVEPDVAVDQAMDGIVETKH